MLSPPTSLEKGTFGPFERALNTTQYGYQILPDPTELAPTQYVERFEVRSGDCGTNGAWSDCSNDRERSELSQTIKELGEGDTAWYGWSVYFPPDFPDISPTKTTIAQFHQRNEDGRIAKPVWMFQHSNGALYLDDQTTGRSTRRIPLIPASDLRANWHNIKVKVRWAKDESGRLNIWINGAQVFEYQGPTMNAKKVYFRYGLYRSFISRYKTAENSDIVPTQIALFANVNRAKTRRGLN